MGAEVQNARESGARVIPLVREVKAKVQNLNFRYGTRPTLKNINMEIPQHQVIALIGPSGCGKTTLLRCFNRMHDLYPNSHYDGQICLSPDDINILDPHVDPILVRMRISMVFQKPNPFPKSIFENVAYGLRVRGIKDKKILNEKVERALRRAALWDEVKDRIFTQGTQLSGGQQQRLCIARALAADPEIVLFDEPTSALDPIATSHIEELMKELKSYVTLLVVTHNMQQAQRISDRTAFIYMGELAEYAPTKEFFEDPKAEVSKQYISGRFS